MPCEISWQQNYPNPFNEGPLISFNMTRSANVELVIYNILGQRVRTLVSGPFDAGPHEVNWDGRDESGKTVSSGIYLYQLSSGKFTDAKKMILLK